MLILSSFRLALVDLDVLVVLVHIDMLAVGVFVVVAVAKVFAIGVVVSAVVVVDKGTRIQLFVSGRLRQFIEI